MSELKISTVLKMTFTLTDKNIKKVKRALKGLEKAGIKLSDPSQEDIES